MSEKIVQRRLFPRLSCQAPLRYQKRGLPEFGNSITSDISSGGVGFSADKYFTPNTLLMLEINVLSKVLRPIARVVWSNPASRSDRFRLGAEFVEFDVLEKKHLDDFIKLKSATL